MKISVNRKRAGVSELVGTLIMVTITLIAGAAVFGWINGQANSSETAYGQSVANNIQFLREHFVVVTQSFGASPAGGACSTVGGTSPYYECTLMTFWVYNAGQIGFNLYTVRVQNLTDIPGSAANKNPLNILFYTASATACSSSPQNCGFVYYNKAGSTALCTDTAAWQAAVSSYQPGFYENPPAPIGTGTGFPTTLAQGLLTSSPYQISMPGGTAGSGSGCATQYLYDGITYTLTFTGLYGNSISTTVTVNG